MSFTKLKKLLVLLVIAMVLVFPSPIKAQLSEGEMTEFVPAGTFLFLSMNMESIMEHVAGDHEIIMKFRDRENFTSMDFTETSQVLSLLTSEVADGAGEYSMPGAVVTRYKDVVDKESYFSKLNTDYFSSLEFESTAHNGHEFYHGKSTDDDFQIIGGTTSVFFPAENIVAVSDEFYIGKVIDGGEEDSPGKELLSNLDSDADIHVVMEDGSKLTALIFFDDAAGELFPGMDVRETVESIQRFELIADYDQMTPIKATLEMKSGTAANDLESLLRTGLQAVPPLLETGAEFVEDAIEQENDDVVLIADQLRSLISLGQTATGEVEISRDGSTIEIQLGTVDGLDKLAEHVITLMAWQKMNIEEMMQSAPDGMGHID